MRVPYFVIAENYKHVPSFVIAANYMRTLCLVAENYTSALFGYL